MKLCGIKLSKKRTIKIPKISMKMPQKVVKIQQKLAIRDQTTITMKNPKKKIKIINPKINYFFTMQTIRTSKSQD